MDTNGLRDRLGSIGSNLALDYAPYRNRWMQIQEFVMPRRGHFLRKDRNKPAAFTQIIDNTASMALRTLQSGMQAGITSPARPWFQLSLADKDLAKSRHVKDWLHTVRGTMLGIFSNSNVYNSLHTLYGDMGGFGTGAIMPVFDYKDIIRTHTLSIGSYKIGTNARGVADVIHREFQKTVFQMVSEYGLKKVSQSVKDMYANGDYSQQITIHHFILPNDRRDTRFKDSANKAYMSVHFEDGSDKENYLRISGFDEFPIMVPRWEVKGEDFYGSGPGDMALGDTKQLQIQQKRKAQAIDKQVSPPLQAPISQKSEVISSVPGGVTYYNQTMTSDPGVRSLYKVDLRINDLKEDIRETQSRISRAYYEDLFLMISQSDRRDITAREIDERHEEKLLMIGPVIERTFDELLDPLIDRTFNIALEKGVFPPPPRELANQKIEVEYTSLLAQAQKSVGTTAIERTVGFIGSLSAVYPSARHKIDAVKTADTYAELMGMPPDLIRPDDEVAALVKQEQEAQQQEQAMAAAAEGAQSAKVLADTEVGGGQSALEMIAGNM